MNDWFPMPRYWVTLAAESAWCGHIVWAHAIGSWPESWTGPLYCPRCDQVGHMKQWWWVR